MSKVYSVLRVVYQLSVSADGKTAGIFSDFVYRSIMEEQDRNNSMVVGPFLGSCFRHFCTNSVTSEKSSSGKRCRATTSTSSIVFPKAQVSVPTDHDVSFLDGLGIPSLAWASSS